MIHAEDSKMGPDAEQGNINESDVQFPSDKPDTSNIPHTRYNNR